MTVKKTMRNIPLEEEGSYADLVPAGVSFMEDHGFLIMGESEEGDEISLVSTFFRLGGGVDGPWMVDDRFCEQTTLLVIPKGQRGAIHDNHFIGNRTWGIDHWRSGQITKTDDEVIWKIGNLQHICRPPVWELKGEHLGIEFDFVLGATEDATYHKGKYSEFEANGIGGYEMPVWAEGTVRAEGKTYTMKREKTFCNHEKFTQPAWDLAKVLTGETYYWSWFHCESALIFIYYYPSEGKAHSHVSVEGQSYDFNDHNGQSNISMEELEWWIDPKTRMRIPVKWHFNITSKNGVIDFDVAASHRTFYSFLTESGATMHYGLHSLSQGQVAFPDGRKVQMKDMRSYIEHGWCAIPLSSAAC